jgi:phospho-N-acetylmuramoyl-pentapeptide-transferase
LFYLLSRFYNIGVVHYISFRSVMALLTAFGVTLFLGPIVIDWLKSMQIGQVIRHNGPQSHLSKAGRPTMGGVLMLLGASLSALLWMDWGCAFTWQMLFLFIGLGMVGLWDDYSKLKAKKSDGIKSSTKLFWQIFFGSLFLLWHLSNAPLSSTFIHMPFVKTWIWQAYALYFPVALFIITGSSNAVNLTDGLDGLAIMPVIVAASSYALLSYVSGNVKLAEYLYWPYVSGAGELTVFAACLVGTGLGFLWFNAYPAEVFMGDVGSLSLGGALGGLAILSKHEMLLALIGGIFVLETLSVMGQVASFKLRGKRILRMAPIHHHFELKGWPEPKVIVRFWILSFMFALLGLLTLKIR